MLPTTLRDCAYVPKRVKEEIDFDGPIERGAKKIRAQRVQEFLTLNGFSVSKTCARDLLLVRKVPGDWVHVGIVTAPAKESFDTAEGNTDSGGSSNGFEAAERARGYASKDFIVW